MNRNAAVLLPKEPPVADASTRKWTHDGLSAADDLCVKLALQYVRSITGDNTLPSERVGILDMIHAYRVTHLIANENVIDEVWAKIRENTAWLDYVFEITTAFRYRYELAGYHYGKLVEALASAVVVPMGQYSHVDAVFAEAFLDRSEIAGVLTDNPWLVTIGLLRMNLGVIVANLGRNGSRGRYD